MYGKLTRILAAALLTAGVSATSVALAEEDAKPAVPQQQSPNSMQGPGMMGGQAMPNGQNMSGMTRMANTCNTMMERASHTPASPGTPAPGTSRG
jgi:hypothetical protein